MKQHTPGPWVIAEKIEQSTRTSMRMIRSKVEGHDHGAVCEVYGVNDGTEAAANAVLITAAPLLAEALIECLAEMDHYAPRGQELFGKFADRIRKKSALALKAAGVESDLIKYRGEVGRG